MGAAPQLVLVDHDAQERRRLVDFLGSLGFRVTGFDTAAALRAVLRRAPPDLLLLDMQLPGEDGIALVEDAHAAWPEMGIIMLGEGQGKPCAVGLEAGADDGLSRPFAERELLARVRSVLRRLPLSAAPQ